MNKRLLAALLSVSTSSTDTKALADKVLSESSVENIAALHAQVAELQRQISALTLLLLPDEAQLADDDKQVLAMNFTARLSDATANDLHQYNRENLRNYSNAVRLVLVTVLRNKAFELKVPGLEIWTDIIALDGGMK